MDFFEKQKERRRQAYPTDERAIACLHDAYAHLLAEGWQDAVFQPPGEGCRWIRYVERGSPLEHVRSYPAGAAPDTTRMLVWKPELPPELRAAKHLDPAALRDFVERHGETGARRGVQEQ
ncbi:MAG TPA: hypothetical protein VME41_13650 [Stellaceae bacterium]|nr:hypothetical protein [Stellaceae bacterium]